MLCRNCGEENPENAVFCRNCGAKLKEEEVKKAEVIEAPARQNNNNYQKTTQTTTTSSSDNKGSDWTSCCICLVAIFIVFAIIGLL